MYKLKINKFLLFYIITHLFYFSQENFKYYNFLQLNIQPKTSLDIFFIDQNNKNKISNHKLYQFFNSVYLQNIYKIKLKEKNINSINILPQKLTNIVLFKVRHVNFKNFNIKYFNEIAHLFLINIWLKNLKNLCKYMKKKLDTVHFKKHRFYFLFFFKILNKYIKPNFQSLQIKGIYLVFRGKLGKGGNSRKKVMFYKSGYYSLSNKLLCLNTQKWDVWTRTGTVGCTMRVFYKKYDNFFKFIYNCIFSNFN